MRQHGVVLHQKIAEILESEIAGGLLARGARLPTEPELAERFEVNRHTVRQATKTLIEMGLVVVQAGKGTFVANGLLNYPVAKRTRFTEIVSRQNARPSAKFLKTALVPASGQLAKDLEIENDAVCILIETLHSANGIPITFASHYFVQDRFPGLAKAVKRSGSLTRALAACGLDDYYRLETRATARMPSAEEARRLQQPASRPILVSETVNVDTKGVPIEHCVSRSSGDRVALVFRNES